MDFGKFPRLPVALVVLMLCIATASCWGQTPPSDGLRPAISSGFPAVGTPPPTQFPVEPGTTPPGMVSPPNVQPMSPPTGGQPSGLRGTVTAPNPTMYPPGGFYRRSPALPTDRGGAGDIYIAPRNTNPPVGSNPTIPANRTPDPRASGGMIPSAMGATLTSPTAALMQPGPTTPNPTGSSAPAGAPVTAPAPTAVAPTAESYQPQIVSESGVPLSPSVVRLLQLKPQPRQHMLVPLVNWAKEERDVLEEIKDYQVVMVKQERVKGELLPSEQMLVRIRHEPFSVYIHFLSPEETRGQEVMYIEGWNNGMMKAHGVGMLGLAGTQNLDPEGMLAMGGNRYPITDIGLVNLVDKFIETGEKESKYGECSVRIFPHMAKINGRQCTCIQVSHPHAREEFMFYRAQIYIDDELGVPIRYEAFDWPEEPGGKGELVEAYTYCNLQLNVGFTDEAFNWENPKYNFK